MEKEYDYRHRGRTTMGPAPIIKKLGVINARPGEMSVFVWKGQMYYSKVTSKKVDDVRHTWVMIYNAETGEPCARFGEETDFMSIYCEDDRLYAFCRNDNKICSYVSDDMENWEVSVAFEMPEKFLLHNTSVCKGENPDGSARYIMAFEASRAYDMWSETDIDPDIGFPFTEFFAESPDLVNWTVLPYETAYSTERYVACPVIRYSEGYYYMICTEWLPCFRFVPYIYRTKDFLTWEIGIHNPVLMFDDAMDRTPAEGFPFTAEEREYIANFLNTNNSDVDLCEYEGKTYIFYNAGDQGSTGVCCKAVYDGPQAAFLKAFFDE